MVHVLILAISKLHSTDTDITQYSHIGTNTDTYIGIGASLMIIVSFIKFSHVYICMYISTCLYNYYYDYTTYAKFLSAIPATLN